MDTVTGQKVAIRVLTGVESSVTTFMDILFQTEPHHPVVDVQRLGTYRIVRIF